MPRRPDDSLDAIPLRPEPARAAYVSDWPKMPPIPKRCPKCAGCLHTYEVEFGEHCETKCINCGFYLSPLMPDFEPEHRGKKSGPGKTGAVLPIIMESR